MFRSDGWMSADEAKDLIIETCKTPVQMEIAQMGRSLERWGFRIVDFELCSDPAEGTLPLYVVWLECRYGIELARTNLTNWAQELPQFPWLGSWEYVVKYCRDPAQPPHEFHFTVNKFMGDCWTARGLPEQPKWPFRWRGHLRPNRSRAQMLQPRRR